MCSIVLDSEDPNRLCRTAGRKEKEKAIRNRLSNRMETALHELEKAIVAGLLKDRNKMERRLGKIQARHPQVNDLYEFDLRDTAEGIRLFWQMKQDRKNWREAREGAHPGRVPRLRLVGHPETSAEGPAPDCACAIGKRCR